MRSHLCLESKMQDYWAYLTLGILRTGCRVYWTQSLEFGLLGDGDLPHDFRSPGVSYAASKVGTWW